MDWKPEDLIWSPDAVIFISLTLGKLLNLSEPWVPCLLNETNTIHFIRLTICFLFFFAVLGVVFRALYFLGRHSTTWVPLSVQALSYWRERFSVSSNKDTVLNTCFAPVIGAKVCCFKSLWITAEKVLFTCFIHGDTEIQKLSNCSVTVTQKASFGV
jgi:hypothetical protein